MENPEIPDWGANGTAQFYAGHWEGYTGFSVRVDNIPGLKFGDAGENVVVVHVDAEHGTGWWYEGGGIYRPVHLVSTNTVQLGAVRYAIYMRGGTTVAGNLPS